MGGFWYSVVVTKKKVKLSLENADRSSAIARPIGVGGAKLTLSPWSTVSVKYHKVTTIRDFYTLMTHTKFVRQSIVNAYISDSITPAMRNQVEALDYALQTLESVTKTDRGLAQMALDQKKRINLDLSYEIEELKKDICYLEEGTEGLYEKYMRPKITDFNAVVQAGITFLGGEGAWFRNLITDRDGTINNYCGRYKSSIQSAYNSIFLTSFVQTCCQNAVILTAAPLQGLIDVSVNPDNTLIYAASKGREFIDLHGHYQSAEMEPQQRELMRAFNSKLKQLVRQPHYEKFTLIGSGLQFKFGQTAVSRQDMSGSISKTDSEDFLRAVRAIVNDVAPNGELILHDTGNDIEISPSIVDSALAEETATFHKGKGLEFLNERLSLGVEVGPNLVCGDTISDIPMLEAAMSLCPNSTYGIFCSKDKHLIAKANSVCPRTIILPCPDVLVSIMIGCAKLKACVNTPRSRSFSMSLGSPTSSSKDISLSMNSI
eukprot:NODE_1768_length_1817_cov_47.417946_g1498_i0.p1 GENE.NODE_1768_length_1817_cov_47.417946_g1498_i0~~NODE_1768_length_1817_cov_47.417946_g1498_i0.p1  ORF type:complete len:516 (-),score=82.41 NODE_1768_length_1817_cov_47.417946_g1498_i0:268-1731(-)